MKISRNHFMFLYYTTRPIYTDAGACREVMYHHMRTIGNTRVFPSLNLVDTSEP